MANENLSAMIAATPVGGTLVLNPVRAEFQGPVTLIKAITIRGQGGTIWAEQGPVVIVQSAGVILEDINIEVTGAQDKLSGQATCALIVPGTQKVQFTRVGVRGDVEGVPGEDRGWQYPRILRLNRIASGREHVFRIRLFVPVSCRIESQVSGVSIAPRDLPAGPAELDVRVEKLSDGVRLRGMLLLSTAALVRRIEVSGTVVADAPGIISGVGQVIYEPIGWAVVTEGAEVTVSPVVSPPVVTAPVSPPPVIVPPKVVVPLPPMGSSKPKRIRITDPQALPSVFGETEKPAETTSESTSDAIRSADAETQSSVPTSPPIPTKKSGGMRKTDKLSGFFDDEKK